MSVLYGVDVSHYNGTLDWSAISNAGISWATCKVSEGHAWRDPTGAANLDGMRDAGLVYGAYHFLRSDSAVADQAQNFVDAVRGAGHDPAAILVQLDVEIGSAGSAPSADDVTGWVEAFHALVPGKPVLLYLPGWYIAQQMPGVDLSGSGVWWQSHYVSGSGDAAGLYGQVPDSWWDGTAGWSEAAILQYSDAATVAGASLDINAFRGDADALKTIAGINVPAPAPAPPPAPDPGSPPGHVPAPPPDGTPDPGLPPTPLPPGPRLHLALRTCPIPAHGRTVT